MATLTRQYRQPPSSGNTGTLNGNPLSSRLGYDLIQGCNNLHYTMPWAGYAAAPSSDGTHLGIVAGASIDGDETFAAMFPTMIPDGMKRFHWTLGFYASSTEADNDYVINPVNVYLTPAIYNARTSAVEAPNVEQDAVFDRDRLGGNYGRSEYATPITFTALSTGEVWHYINMSAGTTLPVPFENKITPGGNWLNTVNVVLTMQPTRGGGAVGVLNIRLAGFSFWWSME